MSVVTPPRSCRSCDSSLADDAAFCHRCGAAAEAVTAARRPGATQADGGAARARLQRALGAGYQLRHVLGRGGFAEVYAAWDVRLRREVAVKTIRPDVVLSDDLIARFRREIDAVAGLRHPHLVPIYDVGERDDVVYFTMPRIVGETLADVLARETRLDVTEGARILCEAGGALAAAHRAGVVHRDVKPENIMLEGLDRRVALTDFGIAKSMGAQDGGEELTGSGLSIGTPLYMSPEQAMGERAVDERADQYSLALVGYRMLAGRLPFADGGMRAVMFRQVTEVPPPLSDVRPEVPDTLSRVIARALAKEPALRYPSMQEFVAAITEATRGGGATPRAGTRLPPVLERVTFARKARARWRWAAALAAAGVALLVAGAVIAPAGAGIPVAAGRDEARYAARAFLRSLGHPATGLDRITLVADDSVHAYLHTAGGRADADRAGAADGAVWRWRVNGYDRPGRVARTVELTPEGRVVSFAEIAADTAAVRVSMDSARRLAAATLTARGWRPEGLRLVRQSASQGGGRATVYAFEWAPTAAPRAAVDTSARLVRVEVTGDRVSRYDDRRELPREAAGVWAALASAARALGWGVVVAALLYACVLAVRRAHDDALDWSLGLRAAAACCVLTLIIPTAELVGEWLIPADFRGDGWNGVLGMGISAPIVLVVMTGVVAAAESLAREHRARLVLGMHELTAGRLDAPELPGAALFGSAIGVVAAGLAGVVEATAHALVGPADPTGVPWALEYGSVPLAFGTQFGCALGGALLLLFACALAASRRLPAWLAVAGATTVCALVSAPHAGAELPGWLAGLVAVGAAAGAVWRLGAVGGTFALLVCQALPDVVGLLRARAPGTTGMAVASAAWLLVPLAVALWGWQARMRGAGGPAVAGVAAD